MGQGVNYNLRSPLSVSPFYSREQSRGTPPADGSIESPYGSERSLPPVHWLLQPVDLRWERYASNFKYADEGGPAAKVELL